MLAEIGRSERPAWKRIVGRVMKRLLAWRYRDFNPAEQPARWVRVAGLRLRVLASVFNPSISFTSGFLANYLGRPGVLPTGASVLEIGTGSGIVAIAAARAGAGRVVATDINPAAARCARENALRYGLGDRIRVREGDMFAPVAGEHFSLIVCNPPYFRGTPSNLAEAAYRAGPDYEWLDRFAAGVAAHLAPGGRVLVVLGDAADLPAVLAHLVRDGMRAVLVARRDIWIEVLYIYELRPPPNPAEQERDLVRRLRCPECDSGLAFQPAGDETRALCRQCDASYPRCDGVWRMLTASREREYAPFLTGYNELRRREGWVRPASYYLGLPHVGKRDPAAHVWRIRRRSFQRLQALVGQGGGRAALDLGAGNGWLARRLAAWGYTAVASDLNAEGVEGLEGGRLYIEHDGNWFGRVQATMDALPFADAAFALCTISASIHYTNLGRTLAEAWRVLAPGGLLLITDSPVYTRAEAGRQMADEQHARIRARLGADPQPLPGGAGFLVEAELLAEMRSAGFRAHTIPTDHRLGRIRRGLRLRQRREEARFPVVVGRKPGEGT